MCEICTQANGFYKICRNIDLLFVCLRFHVYHHQFSGLPSLPKTNWNGCSWAKAIARRSRLLTTYHQQQIFRGNHKQTLKSLFKESKGKSIWGGWMGWQRVRNPPHQPLSTEWIFLQLKWHIEHISPANMWVFVCKIFSASKRNAPSLTIRWNNKWPFVFRFHVIYFPSMPPAQCIFRSTLSLPAYSSISKSNHFLFLPRYSMRRASEWKRDAKQWNLWYISCCTQIIGLVYSNKKSLFFWSVTYYIELHSKI